MFLKVTIHNISESKFHRGEHSAGTLANSINGVEITRIPSVGNRPMMGASGSSSPLHHPPPIEQSAAITLGELHQKALQLELRRQLLINQEAQKLLKTTPPPPMAQPSNHYRGHTEPPPGFVEPHNRAVGSNRMQSSVRPIDATLLTNNHHQTPPTLGSNEFGGMWFGNFANASKMP